MNGSRFRTLRRLLVALGVSVLLAAIAVTPTARSARGPAATTSRACRGAGSVTQDVRLLMRAIACLHNHERRRHGLRALRWNRPLALAAARHGRDMVRRHYFSHRSPEGTNHMRRIASAGYGHGARCWSAGENLLYSPTRSTPRQVFASWMGSAVHRANILDPRWHDLGLGVVMASPSGRGMTLVALFGRRSSGGCA